MLEKIKSHLRENKNILLSMINFLLFPYVLGHIDGEVICEYVITKKNCTAVRCPGNSPWQIHDNKNSSINVLVISPKNGLDWKNFNFKIFKQFFEAEQFSHPFRAMLIEPLIS